jgi:predicted transposase/invertase (TIGR01784 family)
MPDSSEITQPHDRLFKQLLGERENAVSFLEHNLPRALLRHLDLDSLEVVQTSFIDSQFVQSEADLLFSLRVADGPGYVYVLFEHQSSPDALMLLRLLSYMVRVWRRHTREQGPSDRLPVIIPMVLFHGPAGWQGPTDFQSLVAAPDDAFSLYTPQFACCLFDLSGPRVAELAGNALVRIMGALLASHGRPDFRERLARAFATLHELIHAPGFSRYFEIIFRYILKVHDLPKEELLTLAAGSMHREMKEMVMTTYQRLIDEGKELGLQQGKELGLQQGKELGIRQGKELGEEQASRRIAARLIARRFGTREPSFHPYLERLDAAKLEELSEKVLEVAGLDELMDWIRSAAGN